MTISGVSLTDAECRIYEWVGTMRHRDAVEQMRDPGCGSSNERKGPDNHIMGAGGEYACSILLNLFWRPHIGEIDQIDVGDLVEVRTVASRDYHLIIRPDAKPLPHVLMLQQCRTRFECLGWRWPHQVFAEYPCEVRCGRDPAYWVPSTALVPVAALKDIVKRQEVG